MDYKQEFLQLMLRKSVLKIAKDKNSLFKFKSGRMSPNFVSIGALTDGESLSVIKKCYAQAAIDGVKKGVLKDFQYVFGPAYKGINLCALTCEGLFENHAKNVMYLYDRKEEKNYGESTQGTDATKVIVGAEKFVAGSSILLVDDVITTGQAKYDALEKIKLLQNYNISGMVIAVDRQELMGDAINIGGKSAVQTLEEGLGIKTQSILTMQEIFAIMKDTLSEEIRNSWVEYYDKYGAVKMR